MTKPKPCPFCGGEARTVWHPPDKGKTFGYAFVECIKCGAVPWSTMAFDEEQGIGGAVRDWNRRAT